MAVISVGKGEKMNIEGEWAIVMDSPMGDQKLALSLVQEDENFSGSLNGGMLGSASISEGKVNGDILTWQAKVKRPLPLKLKFTGSVNGDSISGDVVVGRVGTAKFYGKRLDITS
jgi:hypothetical protein